MGFAGICVDRAIALRLLEAKKPMTTLRHFCCCPLYQFLNMMISRGRILPLTKQPRCGFLNGRIKEFRVRSNCFSKRFKILKQSKFSFIEKKGSLRLFSPTSQLVRNDLSHLNTSNDGELINLHHWTVQY